MDHLSECLCINNNRAAKLNIDQSSWSTPATLNLDVTWGILKENNLRHSYLNVMKLESFGSM
jgi:hypothetical protein